MKTNVCKIALMLLMGGIFLPYYLIHAAKIL